MVWKVGKAAAAVKSLSLSQALVPRLPTMY